MSLPALAANGRQWKIAAIVVLSTIQAVAAGVSAFAIRDLFGALHGGAEQAPAGARLALLLGATTIALAHIAARRVAEDVGHRYADALRRAIYRHIARLPAATVQRRRIGGLGLRFVGDLSAARLWIGQGLCRLIAGAIILPGAATALFMIAPPLAVAAAAPLVLGLILMTLASFAMESRHRVLRKVRAALAIDALERIGSAAALDLFGRTGKELSLLKKKGEALRSAGMRRVSLAAALSSVCDMSIALASVSMFIAAFEHGVTPAEMAAGLAMLAILAGPLRDLASVWDRRGAWRIARRKCEALFRERPAPRRGGVGDPASTPPDVWIRDLAAPPLHRFSANVQAGERVAVEGAESDGRSALLSALAGLNGPSAGAITFRLPGVGRKIPAADVRTGHIGREPTILRGSLRRALCLGTKRRPKDTELMRTLQAYGLADAAERLGGLDGRVETAGRNLSAAERRRVQLAQCALRKPDLLILDAPIDDFGEGGAEAVLKLFEESAATIFYANGDPKLLKAATRIWRLEEGRLQEQRWEGLAAERAAQACAPRSPSGAADRYAPA